MQKPNKENTQHIENENTQPQTCKCRNTQRLASVAVADFRQVEFHSFKAWDTTSPVTI